MILIAIVSISFSLWADTINNTSLAAIYTQFQDAGAFLQTYIITGPYLVSIPFVLIVGKLAEKINKKTLMVISLLIYTVGGVSAAFANSMAAFALSRSLAGIATCIIGALAHSIIFENFPKANDSAKVMGIYQAFSTGYGAVLGIAAGIVCTINWRYAQYLNGLAILSALAVLLFLPKVQSAKADAHSEEGHDPEEESEYVIEGKTDVKRVIFTLFEATFSIVFCFVFNYFVALYVVERGIGTEALAGLLASLMTLGGVVANVLLGRIFEVFQRYTGIVFALVCALVMTILGFDAPVWLVITAALLNGVVVGVICSYYPIAVNQYVPAKKSTFYQSVYACVMYVGFYLVSFVPNLYMSIFGGGYQRVMRINGIILAAAGVLLLLVIKSVIAKKPVKTAEK